MKMAPKRGVKILDDAIQEWTAGWAPRIVDEDVNGAQSFGSRCEGSGQCIGFFEVQHEGLVPSITKAGEFFAQGISAAPFRAQTVMSAPAFAIILAVASPMPLLAPQTKACFPGGRLRERVVVSEEVHASAKSPQVIALGLNSAV